MRQRNLNGSGQYGSRFAFVNKLKMWFYELKLGMRALFRKRAAKMIIAANLLILGVLFIIAMFYKDQGLFVVSVDDELEEAGFALSTSSDFESPRVKLFSKACEDCYNININDLPKGLNEGEGSHNGDDYLAYSFYVKNMGGHSLNYNYEVDIGKATQGIEEAAWVMVIVNDKASIYAMKHEGRIQCQYSYDGYEIANEFENVKAQVKQLSKTDFGNMSKEDMEKLGIDNPDSMYELSTIPFVDEKTVVKESRKGLKPGDTDKYTVVVWLEGEDFECVDDIIGGAIEMEMNFSSEN